MTGASQRGRHGLCVRCGGRWTSRSKGFELEAVCFEASRRVSHIEQSINSSRRRDETLFLSQLLFSLFCSASTSSFPPLPCSTLRQATVHQPSRISHPFVLRSPPDFLSDRFAFAFAAEVDCLEPYVPSFWHGSALPRYTRRVSRCPDGLEAYPYDPATPQRQTADAGEATSRRCAAAIRVEFPIPQCPRWHATAR